MWDIYNNSSEDSLNFVVVSSAGMILDNLLNFPNPFSESTSISFEHNDQGADLDITIDIFNMAGKLMKTIKTKEYDSGFRSKPIEWNGYDEMGNKSRQGLYIYRIHVKSSDGKEATRIRETYHCQIIVVAIIFEIFSYICGSKMHNNVREENNNDELFA